MLANVVLAGATILATGLAIDATINVALVETAEDIEPAAVQALSALWTNDFLVFVLGGFVFMLATGISIIRHGALPKWLGWVAMVLAIASMTPAGFFAFVGIALWMAIASVMLTMRARRGGRPSGSGRAARRRSRGEGAGGLAPPAPHGRLDRVGHALRGGGVRVGAERVGVGRAELPRDELAQRAGDRGRVVRRHDLAGGRSRARSARPRCPRPAPRSGAPPPGTRRA